MVAFLPAPTPAQSQSRQSGCVYSTRFQSLRLGGFACLFLLLFAINRACCIRRWSIWASTTIVVPRESGSGSGAGWVGGWRCADRDAHSARAVAFGHFGLIAPVRRAADPRMPNRIDLQLNHRKFEVGFEQLPDFHQEGAGRLSPAIEQCYLSIAQ